MPQLSIFDKKQHRSTKDVTLSIGKDDRMTITFRNESWKKLTKGNYIRLWASNGKLKFSDANETTEGRVYKLIKNNKNPNTSETTRYIQPTGSTLPHVAEIVKKYNGNSYDLPKTKEIAPDTEITDEDLERHARKMVEKNAENIPTPDDNLAMRMSPDGSVIINDVSAIHRKQFYTDANYFLRFAQSPEERTEIWRALNNLYGFTTKNGGNT